jgi:DNA-binding XRE family transcriptional regulator
MPPRDKPIPALETALADLERWLQQPGHTKADLARHLGVSRQRLWAWINRTSPPNLEAWLAIQNFLKEQRRRKAL